LEMRERTAGNPFRGAWRPSGGAAQQGGGHGWRRPWGRRGSPLRASRWEEKQGEGKRDKDGADGWGPHVSGCGGLAGRLVVVG
jgi:hypothetical protein